jgi:hypothetical protein
MRQLLESRGLLDTPDVTSTVDKDVAKVKRTKESRSKCAGVKDSDAVATETVIQQVTSKPKWCTAHLKSICPKRGDSCKLPHLDLKFKNNQFVHLTIQAMICISYHQPTSTTSVDPPNRIETFLPVSFSHFSVTLWIQFKLFLVTKSSGK